MQATITKHSQTAPQSTLVSGFSTASRNSKAVTATDGVKSEGAKKTGDFQPISRRISESVRDKAKVIIDH